MIYGRSVTKFAGPEAPTGGGGGLGGGQENDEDAIRRKVAEVLQNAQGCGYKASVGSREVRGEWVVWYKDSDAANSMLKKWKEKEWIKDEEKDPPRYWKVLANKSGGGKTAANVLRDGLAFRQSGETFSIRTSMDVNLVKGSPGQLVSAVNGQNAFGPPNGAPTGPPTGGTGPPGKGPPRGAAPPPPPSGRLPYNASVTTPTGHSPWPPAHPASPLAVLVSGGVDSAVLLAEAVRVYPAVHPLFVRTGLFWEAAELDHLNRFLAAIRAPRSSRFAYWSSRSRTCMAITGASPARAYPPPARRMKRSSSPAATCSSWRSRSSGVISTECPKSRWPRSRPIPSRTPRPSSFATSARL